MTEKPYLNTLKCATTMHVVNINIKVKKKVAEVLLYKQPKAVASTRLLRNTYVCIVIIKRESKQLIKKDLYIVIFNFLQHLGTHTKLLMPAGNQTSFNTNSRLIVALNSFESRQLIEETRMMWMIVVVSSSFEQFASICSEMQQRQERGGGKER